MNATNDVAELARVTCEEYYTEPAYGMDPDYEGPECDQCGDYGYLGVEDEVCTACFVHGIGLGHRPLAPQPIGGGEDLIPF